MPVAIHILHRKTNKIAISKTVSNKLQIPKATELTRGIHIFFIAVCLGEGDVC